MEIEMKFMMKIMQSRFFARFRPYGRCGVYRRIKTKSKTLDKFNDSDV